MEKWSLPCDGREFAPSDFLLSQIEQVVNLGNWVAKDESLHPDCIGRYGSDLSDIEAWFLHCGFDRNLVDNNCSESARPLQVQDIPITRVRFAFRPGTYGSLEVDSGTATGPVADATGSSDPAEEKRTTGADFVDMMPKELNDFELNHPRDGLTPWNIDELYELYGQYRQKRRDEADANGFPDSEGVYYNTVVWCSLPLTSGPPFLEMKQLIHV